MSFEEESLIKIATSSRLLNSQRLFLSLIIGFIAGLSLGYFLVVSSDPNHKQILYRKSMQTDISDLTLMEENHIEDIHENENTTLAEILYDEIRVLCWIVVNPGEGKRASHINATWGKRCNKLIFICEEDDEELGSIGIKVAAGKETQLWDRTVSALKYVYENYLDEYNWFLKADLDTYIILENLRYMLSPHSSDIPIYFGDKNVRDEVVYMAGGAGYVLSKEAMKQFVENLLLNSRSFEENKLCDLSISGFEGFELGKCLQSIGVLAGDSRDYESRTTFHPLKIENHLSIDFEDYKDWFWSNMYYRTYVGMNYSSDYAISFDYVPSGFMYTLEFLIYHLKPYGIWSIPVDIPTSKYTLDEELDILREAEKDRWH